MGTKTKLKYLLAVAGACIMFAFVYYTFVPEGRAKWNNYMHSLRKVDDATLYQTRKKVEDHARAMVASYQSDILTYNQYKNSSSSEERSWAQQAKMRANRTASTYNNYILQNSYVWSENVPEDIKRELETVE